MQIWQKPAQRGAETENHQSRAPPAKSFGNVLRLSESNGSLRNDQDQSDNVHDRCHHIGLRFAGFFCVPKQGPFRFDSRKESK